jgi:hypothetical protein
MDLITHLRKYEGEDINWVESETCYYSTASQMTPIWDKLHIGTISSSKFNTWLGRSRFSEGPTESAKQCVGLSKKSFDSSQLAVMDIGIRGEPMARDWYAKSRGINIEEVGIAVWKEDPFFRSSLDGFYTDKDGSKHGIEIKITKDIYWQLVKHYNGEEFTVSNWDKDERKCMHIYGSHYDQMVASMKVCGLKSIFYIVCGHVNNDVYIEEVFPDEDRWNKVLYPGAMALKKDYIDPLMKEHHIKRLDPWMMR